MIPLRQFNDLRARLEEITALAKMPDGRGNVGVVIQTDDGEMLLVGLYDDQEDAEAHRQAFVSVMAKALTTHEKVAAPAPPAAPLPKNVLPFRPKTPAGTLFVNLRDSRYARCEACKHEWVAPTVGKCPKCGGDHTQIMGERFFDYPRS